MAVVVYNNCTVRDVVVVVDRKEVASSRHFHKLHGHKVLLQAVRFNGAVSDSDTRCSIDNCCRKEKWTTCGHSARFSNVAFCQHDNDTILCRHEMVAFYSTPEKMERHVFGTIETGAGLTVLHGHATGAGIGSVDVCHYSFSSCRQQLAYHRFQTHVSAKVRCTSCFCPALEHGTPEPPKCVLITFPWSLMLPAPPLKMLSSSGRDAVRHVDTR